MLININISKVIVFLGGKFRENRNKVVFSIKKRRLKSGASKFFKTLNAQCALRVPYIGTTFSA
jgi:hypothetical protein